MTLLDRPQLQQPQQGFELAPMHLDTAPVSDPLTDAYRGNVEDFKEELDLLLQEKPFLSGTRPDGRTFKLFWTDATSPLSNPAKALDATVRETDPRWKDGRDETVKSLGPIQKNSFYFTYVDTTNPENPRVLVSLMGTDLTKEEPEQEVEEPEPEIKSETETYFMNENPGVELPPEFVGKKGDLKWDIVSVMADPSARISAGDLYSVAYAYAGLYAAACIVAGIGTEEQPRDMLWISSLSGSERKSLVESLGIPFKELEGVSPTYAEVTNHKGEVKRIKYEFCSLYVGDIKESMIKNIAKLEENIAKLEDSSTEFDAILLAIAKIALFADPNFQVTVEPEHNRNQDLELMTLATTTQAA